MVSRTKTPQTRLFYNLHFVTATPTLLLKRNNYVIKGWRVTKKTHASSPSTSGKTHEKTCVIQTRPDFRSVPAFLFPDNFSGLVLDSRLMSLTPGLVSSFLPFEI